MPLPDTHNPSQRNASLDRCTIRAMLVGAPKAGTTSLYRYAAQHQGIVSHEQREMTFFFSDTEYPRGYKACLRKYAPDDMNADAVFLAKHVFTMYRPVAIARLKQHNPDVHVFALLRDPVKRAYSSYWYSRRRGWDPATGFEQAVRWELGQPDRADDWLADRDRLHLRVGVYHPYVQGLVETFGRDHVHVFLTDELSHDAAGLCRKVYDVLGIDNGFVPDLTRTHNPAAAARSQTVARAVAGVLKSNGRIKRTLRRLLPHGLARRSRHALLRINEKDFTPPPMPDKLRRELYAYYAPHNRVLAEWIGRDLSTWSGT